MPGGSTIMLRLLSFLAASLKWLCRTILRVQCQSHTATSLSSTRVTNKWRLITVLPSYRPDRTGQIVPARSYQPKDKAKAEVGVQIVERWIMARLRHQSFFTLASLNQAIATLLIDLNQRPFKKLPGSRASLFKQLDQPVLGTSPCSH